MFFPGGVGFLRRQQPAGTMQCILVARWCWRLISGFLTAEFGGVFGIDARILYEPANANRLTISGRTMRNLRYRLTLFFNNRWLVFVAAMWIQGFAGSGYLFGSISPTIKEALNYNQRQIARVGVAKDLGGSVALSAGILCQILPSWAALLVGVVHNLVGYGGLWLITTARVPALPLWGICMLMFVAANGDTYSNTVALVSCLQNFPKSRGTVMGILKGFCGLSGAILTQIYYVVHSPNQASLILMAAVGPAMVITALMFLVRPVGGDKQERPSDELYSSVIYIICLLLAAYLMVVMLVEDMIDLSHTVIIIFTAILLVLLLIPIAIPISMSFSEVPRAAAEEPLLYSQNQEHGKFDEDTHEYLSGEVEYENPEEVDQLTDSEIQKGNVQLLPDLSQAAEKAVIVRRSGPNMGEDFTLMQALMTANFWLIVFSLLVGSGSGLTVIDNLGQMSQSLGYENSHIFVSMISIWNFLGRIAGGYLSEIIARDYAYPRHAALAVAQFNMAIGHFFFAMGWPGSMYIGTLLVGLSYGAHWAIVPAAASELFGIKSFGAFYNFLNLVNPCGSLIFSGLIASSIYDREAEKQAREGLVKHENLVAPGFSRLLVSKQSLKCRGAVCFCLSSLIMCGFCVLAVLLSTILVYRVKHVYARLYGNSEAPPARA